MLDENMKGTRSHCLKLRKTQCTRNITRHFFEWGGQQTKSAGSADSRCT